MKTIENYTDEITKELKWKYPKLTKQMVRLTIQYHIIQLRWSFTLVRLRKVYKYFNFYFKQKITYFKINKLWNK